MAQIQNPALASANDYLSTIKELSDRDSFEADAQIVQLYVSLAQANKLTGIEVAMQLDRGEAHIGREVRLEPGARVIETNSFASFRRNISPALSQAAASDAQARPRKSSARFFGEGMM